MTNISMTSLAELGRMEGIKLIWVMQRPTIQELTNSLRDLAHVQRAIGTLLDSQCSRQCQVQDGRMEDGTLEDFQHSRQFHV